MILTEKGFGPEMPYHADITRIGALALFDLKGQPDDLRHWVRDLPAFPDTPNTLTPGTPELLYIGRTHWLLRAPLDDEATLETQLRPTQAPEDISIVQISDSICFFSIKGPDADQILSIASSLDTHPTVFPATSATYSETFGLKALITRLNDGFLVGVDQRFGDMIEDYFAKAMR
jgi:sarcosine oxidase subunit gamma